MLHFLQRKIREEQFCPSLIGLLLSPVYFARRGLYSHIAELSAQISGRVLDVGCGMKPYERLFAATEYFGLEIDRADRGVADRADIYYDGRAFPFPDEYFDAVISFQVLEHVERPELFLREVNRVLKPGGRVLMTAPFIWGQHEQPFDFLRYTEFGIKDAFAKSGFTVLQHRKSVDDISIVFQLFNLSVMKWGGGISSRFATWLLHLLFIVPSNLGGQLLSLLKLRNGELYLDNIVLGEKLAKE